MTNIKLYLVTIFLLVAGLSIAFAPICSAASASASAGAGIGASASACAGNLCQSPVTSLPNINVTQTVINTPPSVSAPQLPAQPMIVPPGAPKRPSFGEQVLTQVAATVASRAVLGVLGL